MNKVEYDKKEDVLNVLFAYLRQGTKTDEVFVLRNEIVELINRIKLNGKNYPFINEYDYPDLSIENIKKNNFVNYINLSDEISYTMSKRMSNNIIKRNDRLIWIIHNLSTIDGINTDLKELTNSKVVFSCKNPDDIFTVGEVSNIYGTRRNDLYTDGKVTVLEDYGYGKKVKVDKASFAMYSAFEDDSLVGAVIQANLLDPRLIFTYLQEASSFYKGQIRDTYDEKTSNVLIKRRN